ncbi:MAG: YitT family protein [Candidatus Cellulosilyticum pullistercoris]|uniref:YitT family protein n=1 Tax=Candidatus Cellulosilyticum pullistercoris TaxID=2838521 RepID=A0A9E2K7H0_9FIRM|nr:YitT family protein [Candidatus Cellulosilyticum pullistercoris]
MKPQLFSFNRILSIILGTLLIAIATNGILLPNHLLSGGVNGISMLFYFLFNFKVSVLVILINIPIFILGLLFLRKTYLAYSLFGMLMLSFWLEVTDCISIPTDDTLSILVIAGLLHGLGTGIIFRADGSTGGTDIIAKIINKYFSINMATVTLSLNTIIILLSIYFFNIDIAVLTISTMFISSQVVNFVVDGINRKRTLYIITDAMHFEELSATLLKELHRGVTMIPAIGAYTSATKYILFTTVSVREVAKAKQIVLNIDSKAFMTVTETSQVIGNGRGFTHLDQRS